MQGSGWTSYCAATAYFADANTLGIYNCTAFLVQAAPPMYLLAATGQWPRKVLISR